MPIPKPPRSGARRVVRPVLLRAARVACLATLVASFALLGSAGTLTGPVLDGGTEVELVDVLQFPTTGSNPLTRINMLKEPPDASGRLFVNDLRGPFYAVDGGTIHAYLDLAALRPDLKTSPGLASGFVSFAFHPDFATNGVFYTIHSENVGTTPATMSPALPITVDQHSIVTEWTATTPSSNSFSGTSRELLRIESPHRFHNLSEVAFDPTLPPSDPDYGLLYITAGDFGSVQLGQPAQLQRTDTPYGAILRIDPLPGNPTPYTYAIPSSNPYAGDADPATWDEVYAYGFRNALRIHWRGDGAGAPIVVCIGEANVEEVNLLHAGANYGWPEREGTFALDPVTDPGTVFALPGNDATFGYTYPAAQYDHDEGRAIAGGTAVLGSPAGPLHGQFVFGDIRTGRLFNTGLDALVTNDDGDPATTADVYELGLTRLGLATTLLDVVRDELANPGLSRADLRFHTDAAGTVYVTTKQDGYLRRLVVEPGVPALTTLAALVLVGALLVSAGLAMRRASERT